MIKWAYREMFSLTAGCGIILWVAWSDGPLIVEVAYILVAMVMLAEYRRALKLRAGDS